MKRKTRKGNKGRSGMDILHKEGEGGPKEKRRRLRKGMTTTLPVFADSFIRLLLLTF